MNAGELAELKFIATLGCYRGEDISLNGSHLELKSIETPAKFGTSKVAAYPSDITTAHIKSFSEPALVAFCNRHGINKAGRDSKADIFINNVGYSIKYTGHSPPALVNHTPRLGWEFAARHKKISMNGLDNLVEEYWDKRKKGIISEDVPNTHSESPFAKNIDILLPFLEYFSFEGSGCKLSKHPATCVIEFSDPSNLKTWEKLDRVDFVESIWPRLFFSLRSKGMPSNNKFQSLNSEDKASILKWSQQRDGKLKGSLHVRIR